MWSSDGNVLKNDLTERINKKRLHGRRTKGYETGKRNYKNRLCVGSVKAKVLNGPLR